MSNYEEVVLRHAEYYMLVLEECDRLYKRGGDSVLLALGRFDDERENVLLGQARAERISTDSPVALHLCNRYPDVGALLLPIRLSVQERLRWRLAALEAARMLRDRSTEAAHLVCLGNVYDDMRDFDAAIKAYDQALMLKRELGDDTGEAI